MKKYFKYIFLCLFCAISIFEFSKINAQVFESNFYKSNLVEITDENSEKITKIEKDITKKEKISCFKYDYKPDMSDNNYEYILVRLEINYSDNNGCALAGMYFDSIFRYNRHLKTSKCLSTSHGQKCYDNRFSVEINCRTKNLAMDIGESFGKFSFYGRFKSVNDVSKFVFSCDDNGNIFKRVL